MAKDSMPAFFRFGSRPFWACVLSLGILINLSACGSSQNTPPPVTLSVSLSNPIVTLAAGSSVSVPVVVVAPTETVTFTISSLPAGVTQSYKESESNPSGLLTLAAGPSTQPGTYKPTIVVASSGQTASFTFTLVITAVSAGI